MAKDKKGVCYYLVSKNFNLGFVKIAEIIESPKKIEIEEDRDRGKHK